VSQAPRRALALTTATAALAADLRERILDHELPPGTRLVERELVETYAVARHTVRGALRELQAEGLVRIEPHRGAAVAALDPDALQGLFDLRAALELEAAHRALAVNGGRTPETVREAMAALARTCRRRGVTWHEVVDAHDAAHSAIVDAGESARIADAYAALSGELRLFTTSLRPALSLRAMAAQHEALPAELDRDGVAALRRHLEDGAALVRAAAQAVRPGTAIPAS
jgi:DNA-binding GntR family transcriptional regulator